jgi:hypothetical protein
MKIEESKNLKIKLKGDDADKFKAAIKKIADNDRAIGFDNKALTPDEHQTLKNLSQKL